MGFFNVLKKTVVKTVNDYKKDNNEVNNNINPNDEFDEIIDSSIDDEINDNSTNICNDTLEEAIAIHDIKFTDVYKLPKLSDVFNSTKKEKDNSEWIELKKDQLTKILSAFRVPATISNVNVGPRFTQFEVLLKEGRKISEIVSISKEIALTLAVPEVNIEPYPGRTTICIEIPNNTIKTVHIRSILSEKKKELMSMNLPIVIGKDRYGNSVVEDLTTLPNLIVSGSTGTGKSVFIHSIISSLLVNKRSDEIKLVLMDTSMVDLSLYNGIPHLYYPVITDPKQASIALQAMVKEMEDRYQTFADNKVKNITGYNEMIAMEIEKNPEDTSLHLLPYIAIIVSDLYEKMSVDKNEVEKNIVMLTKIGKEAGIHLILSTQRTSTNTITGNIKNRIPARVSFAVPSVVDSKCILDMPGAEKLLGYGDMLFIKKSWLTPVRIQGSYVYDEEVERLIQYVSSQLMSCYHEIRINIEPHEETSSSESKKASDDPLYNEMLDYAIRAGSISASKLQRQFGLGFNRASKIIDEFEANGIVGPQEGAKPREVLIKKEGVTHYENE
ncbi:MAG: DNA translocase FtsK [Bacilli bacterium]|nr:DNA translocase FtsK [Bacilli bacterium]